MKLQYQDTPSYVYVFFEKGPKFPLRLLDLIRPCFRRRERHHDAFCRERSV